MLRDLLLMAEISPAMISELIGSLKPSQPFKGISQHLGKWLFKTLLNAAA